MTIEMNLNGQPIAVDVEDGNMPLLWLLRDVLDHKGTKFGCGQAACGACTILIDGEALRCCTYAAKFANGKEITTIEGLGSPETPHPIQQAWVEAIVPQCGYCQPGFMMATAALLNKIPNPTDKEIDQNIINICRCGTYYRIRKAIHRAAEIQTGEMAETQRDSG